MSFSYIKRKLEKPEVIQLGSQSQIFDNFSVNSEKELDKQVSLVSNQNLLLFVVVLILIFAAWTYIRKRAANSSSR